MYLREPSNGTGIYVFHANTEGLNFRLVFRKVEFRRYSRENTQIAAEHIKKADVPYFISVGLFNTHRNFPPIADDINPNNISVPYPLPHIRNIRHDMAGFITLARIMDK